MVKLRTGVRREGGRNGRRREIFLRLWAHKCLFTRQVVNNGESSVCLAPETIYTFFTRASGVSQGDNASSERVVAALNIREGVVPRKENTRPKFTITLAQARAGFTQWQVGGVWAVMAAPSTWRVVSAGLILSPARLKCYSLL